MISATPLPVEITNHTDGWVVWLPFAGSALLFVASMITVWWTTRAASSRLAKELEVAKIRHTSEMLALDRRSKTEIEATQQRDHRNWRRDQLLRIGIDVVQCAIDARGELSKAANSWRPMTRDQLDPVVRAAAKVNANTESLALLGADQAAALCRVLYDSLVDDDLWNSGYSLNRSLARDAESPEAQGLDPEYDEVFVSAETRDSLSRFADMLSRITSARSQFNEAVKDALGEGG